MPNLIVNEYYLAGSFLVGNMTVLRREVQPNATSTWAILREGQRLGRDGTWHKPMPQPWEATEEHDRLTRWATENEALAFWQAHNETR